MCCGCRRNPGVAIAPEPIIPPERNLIISPLTATRSSIVAERGGSGATPAHVVSPAHSTRRSATFTPVKHAVVLGHASAGDLKQRAHLYKMGTVHSRHVNFTETSILDHIVTLMEGIPMTELSHLDCEANLGTVGGSVNTTLIPTLECCFGSETAFTGLVQVTLYSGSALRNELQTLFDASHLSNEALSTIFYFEKGKEQDAQAFQRSVVLEEKPTPAVAAVAAPAVLRLQAPAAVYVFAPAMDTPIRVDMSTPTGGSGGGGRSSSARVTPMPMAAAAPATGIQDVAPY